MSSINRIIAFYLPQFHPIPENDKWWGKGFTEWTNTAKAKPLFQGHYQPHVPSDLGFYDLRVPETRIAQAEMAKKYGVEAFCYYHYWFSGKRLIERPFTEVLSSNEPDFPFCLCWANKSWSGIWHGSPNKILIKQDYPGMEDHTNHFYELLKAFTDDRYLKVDNKPVFLVYHPKLIPDVQKVTDHWRELALNAGLNGLHLVGVDHFSDWDPIPDGFDASLQQRLPALNGKIPLQYLSLNIKKLLQKSNWQLTIYDYKKIWKSFISLAQKPYITYPCIVPNWDNSPRSGTNSLVITNSSPQLFGKQIKLASEKVSSYPEDNKLIFLKSWNEWAEGNYMEPDLKFGHAYLDVLKENIRK